MSTSIGENINHHYKNGKLLRSDLQRLAITENSQRNSWTNLRNITNYTFTGRIEPMVKKTCQKNKLNNYTNIPQKSIVWRDINLFGPRKPNTIKY